MVNKTPKRSYHYTREKQLEIKANRKLREAKKKAQKAAADSRKAKQKAKQIEEALHKKVITQDLNQQPKVVKEILDGRPIVFKPNKGPQTDFLASPEEDVLYGGAAGGGKSYALLADLLRYADNGNHRALLLRRTLGELTELIDKSKQFYPKAFPGAVFKEAKSMWQFPSGATALFSYLDKDTDVTRYQGQAFSWIGIDEITHYPTPYVWEYLRSRLRTTDESIIPYMRCTANPGSVGGWWIKKMYIDPSPPNIAFPAVDIETKTELKYPENFPDKERAGKALFYRKFIPARLTDNPFLTRGGEYQAMLMSLPEVERKRLLEGDWDVAEGAAFTEFDRTIHVIDPITLPRGWNRIRAADYGYASPSCVLWGAVDWDGNIVIYRELYVKNHTGEQLANVIIELEKDDPTIMMSVLDSSCWNKTGTGASIAETMIRRGVRWLPADRDRIAGKIAIHRKLQIDSLSLKPRLTIFKTCTNLIRTLPTLPLSKQNPEDVDTKADDHAYDALRYMIMTRHTGARDYIQEAREAREKDEKINSIADTMFGY
jgi:hypothetical protein